MLVAVLSCNLPNASALSQGDGVMVYGEGTVTTPRTRNWVQSLATWTGESSAATAAATIRHTVVKASPTRNEVIAGYQTTGGALYIQRWNGSSWSAEWNVTVGNGSLPRFDIAYEQNSGEAVIMYSTNTGTTNELAYRVWNGTSWTAATNYDALRTAGVVDGVKMAARSGSNDIAVAWGDLAFDLSANFWNGATNTWVAEPAAALSVNLSKVGTATALTNRSFDLTFEGASGELLVAWGNDAVLDLNHSQRGAGVGGAWGAATVTTAFNEEPTDMELASEPGTDYIAYATATDNGGDADAGIWNGSSWGSINNFDTTIDSVAAGTNNVAVEWVQSGAQSRAVVAYDDTNAVGVDWLYFNKNTTAWAAVQADFTTAPAPVGVDDKMLRMHANPFNTSQLMLVVVDNAGGLFAKRLVFDGTNLTWSSTEPGAVALETTMSSTTGFSADYAFNRFVPAGTLGANIVAANGSPVANPSASFTASVMSFDCQTATATLGTASQRVRITNGSATAPWVASIAATSGNGATWSSAGGQYDFNDGAGAPAGCSAGSDGDLFAGRLSVNPSASTVAAEAGCFTNGVSLGSSNAFSQNVLDSITLISASGSAQIGCYWDVTGIALSQQIPPERGAGTYTINMTITVVAN
jgi:hypothetical protein